MNVLKISVVVLLVVLSAASGAFATGTYSQQLLFNNSASSTNLDNFVAQVTYDASDTAFWDNVNPGISASDTKDLRFYDSDMSTELYFEAENIDYANRQAVVWVRVPQVAANSSSDSIYAAWGDAAATQSSYHNSAETWGASYHGVYHFSEAAWDGTAGEVSTSVGSTNGTAVNGATTISDGLIAGAGSFNGSSQLVDLGTSTAYRTDSESISMWIRTTSTGTAYLASSPKYGADWSIHTGAGWVGMNLGQTADSGRAGNVPKDGDWHRLTIQCDGRDRANITMYVDGEDVSMFNLGSAKYLRSNGAIGSRGDGLYAFDGDIDEVRFSSGNLSADWIKASYLSESGAFLTYATAVPEPCTIALMVLGSAVCLRRRR